MKSKLILPALMALTINSVFAAEQQKCERVFVGSDDVVVVTTSLHMTTDIMLPSNLIVEPSVGNSSLWEVQGPVNSPYILVKPNSTFPEGKRTSIKAITESGVYRFEMMRVENGMPCVVVNPQDGTLIRDESALSEYQTSDQRRIEELESQIAELESSVGEHAGRSVRRFRADIQTLYKYESFGRSSFTANNIASVLDDGRRTYVRIKDDRYGVPVVFGTLNGDETLLEYDYDDVLREFVIVGVFETLRLVVKDGGVIIESQYSVL
ncbi:TrbG/VirB9 family P-type conjugative transfer protein [Gammaproteobacteria bacterium]|nr:TrbG/VirB9 family P-type conjugative transfer protein [Gammaproteobacteria bacterium]